MAGPETSELLELVIDARPRELGEGITVNRVLPHGRRRLVGPFIFFDHMGPLKLPAGRGMDVRPHPHIGLATVTYLFGGALRHRDSLGSDQVIRPGDVNWMTAGRGIVHSERSPEEDRAAGPALDGIQVWVALPRAAEEGEPSFVHTPARDIPELSLRGVKARLVLGTLLDQTSPVKVASPTFYLDVELPRNGRFALEGTPEDRAIYSAAAAVEISGNKVARGNLAVLSRGASFEVRASEPTRVVVFGGASLDGPRHLWWNFVSSSEARIEMARRDWEARRFPNVPGDELERIPAPPGPAQVDYP